MTQQMSGLNLNAPMGIGGGIPGIPAMTSNFPNTTGPPPFGNTFTNQLWK